ncbi:OmpA family protein [Acetobacter sp. AN02]|uniref:flagellar motor protein MotB n=1 Tax=Acetobacter sp. AN02 TaxID=2894186 RepID=UPI00243453A6|nr:flagellar motor protein MotB [Acetobacter sp. AN02]MDG6094312.1 OmpA family protein [Acetobacter sp. AN02]
MAKKNGDNARKIVIVRRSGGEGGGHHGGAWKIAYADFVTAMMAFFLVMWLINATTEERRKGIAKFFNPMENSLFAPVASPVIPSVSNRPATTESGVAKQMGDNKQFSDTGSTLLSPYHKVGGFGPDVAALSDQKQGGSGDDTSLSGIYRTPDPAYPDRSPGREVTEQPDVARIVPVGGDKESSQKLIGEGSHEAALKEQENLIRQKDAIEKAAGNSGNVSVQVIPEGLEISLAESDAQPMFENGSSRLNTRAQALMKVIVPYLMALPGKLSIDGYTDSATWKKNRSSNWTLSSQRADAARAELSGQGFPEDRLQSVSGKADTSLAVPDNPAAAGNRRIVLVLHRKFPPPAAQNTAKDETDARKAEKNESH